MPPIELYAGYLNSRIKEVEKRLKQVLPGIRIAKEIDGLLSSTQPTSDRSQHGQELHRKTNVLTTPAIHASDGIPSPPSKEVKSQIPTQPLTHSIATGLEFLQKTRLADIRPEVIPAGSLEEDTLWDTTASLQEGYHGQSSTEALSRDAEILRNEFSTGPQPPWSPGTHRRPEFWRFTNAEVRVLNKNPWQTGDGIAFELPPEDLMPELIDSYFKNTNYVFPLLHRPLFEKQIREGLHFREPSFLRVVMLVCANGSRWSKDPRVLEDKWPVTLSAGHRWFKQAELWNNYVVHHSTLRDGQIILLEYIFLHGSSAHYSSWTAAGVGIRVMQDAGAHRKRETISIENELYKRCFWSLLLFDRLSGLTMGRHSAMQDLDSDLDDVLEVDDEYWSLEPNAPPPVQPEGIPSQFVMFNRLIALCRIMGRGLQTVFALGQTKRQMGLDGSKGDAWMMQDMSAQLTLWARATPSCLRFPRPDDYTTYRFLDHTVSMWSLYFYILLATNRQFINQNSPLAISCFPICREAARACACMLDTHRLTPGTRPLPSSFQAAFSSAMVLLIDLIAQRRTEKMPEKGKSLRRDVAVDARYTMEQKEEDVQKCMRVLEWAEGYFHIAGRLHDIVREFEESWRLRLSPGARSTGSTNAASTGMSSRSGAKQALTFAPTDSGRDLPSGPPIKTEQAEVTFDIAYNPPEIPSNISTTIQLDASTMSQHYPPPTSGHGLLQQNAPSAMQYGASAGLAHPGRLDRDTSGYQQALTSTTQPPAPPLVPNTGALHGSNIPHSFLANSAAQVHGNFPRNLTEPSPIQPHDSAPYPQQDWKQFWDDSVSQHALSNPIYDGHLGYLSGYGYEPGWAAMRPHGTHASEPHGHGQPGMGVFPVAPPEYGVGSSAVPELGVFAPGGWILALNEARLNWDEVSGGGGAEMGGPRQIKPSGGNKENPPKPSILAQWDVMMQNTLALNEQNPSFDG